MTTAFKPIRLAVRLLVDGARFRFLKSMQYPGKIQAPSPEITTVHPSHLLKATI